MRNKNLRGGSVKSDFKKLDSFTLEMSKNHLIRNVLRNGRLRFNKSTVQDLENQKDVVLWRTRDFNVYNLQKS